MSVYKKGIFMKKIVITLIICLVTTGNAFEDLQSTPHVKEEQSVTFLDASSSLLTYEDTSDLDHLSEYDQNVTDNVTPPKVSSAEAMLKEALGSLLIRYITAREVARAYFKDFSNKVAQWYHNITN